MSLPVNTESTEELTTSDPEVWRWGGQEIRRGRSRGVVQKYPLFGPILSRSVTLRVTHYYVYTVYVR